MCFSNIGYAQMQLPDDWTARSDLADQPFVKNPEVCEVCPSQPVSCGENYVAMKVRPGKYRELIGDCPDCFQESSEYFNSQGYAIVCVIRGYSPSQIRRERELTQTVEQNQALESDNGRLSQENQNLKDERDDFRNQIAQASTLPTETRQGSIIDTIIVEIHSKDTVLVNVNLDSLSVSGGQQQGADSCKWVAETLFPGLEGGIGFASNEELYSNPTYFVGVRMDGEARKECWPITIIGGFNLRYWLGHAEIGECGSCIPVEEVDQLAFSGWGGLKFRLSPDKYKWHAGTYYRSPSLLFTGQGRVNPPDQGVWGFLEYRPLKPIAIEGHFGGIINGNYGGMITIRFMPDFK